MLTILEAQRQEKWYKNVSLQTVKREWQQLPKSDLDHGTAESLWCYEQMMMVVSRSGFDFMPGSATSLCFWRQQWIQCTGAVCINGISPAQLWLLERHWCKLSLIPPWQCESLILALGCLGRSPRICCTALSSQGMLSMGFLGRGILTFLCLGFLIGGTKLITLTQLLKIGKENLHQKA